MGTTRKRDHDLIGWVVLGLFAAVFGVLVLAGGVAPLVGLVLLVAGSGVVLAALLRHVRAG